MRLEKINIIIDVIPSMIIDDTKAIKWYVDAAFSVHKDFKVIPVL
jgi:hypothetical protein